MNVINYYMRAHMYTLVPDQLRADMDRMASRGVSQVAIPILEQDLFAAQANIEQIGKAAERSGLSLIAIPSRWGGLVAGAPKVPSLWASTRPQTWSLRLDGTPHTAFGPSVSIFHDDVLPFFLRQLAELSRLYDFAGLIWDEPKRLNSVDLSPMGRSAATRAGVDPQDQAWHRDRMLEFFDRCGAEARRLWPNLWINMFVHGYHANDTPLLDAIGCLESLDAFGLDGRPWRLGDASGFSELREEDEDGKSLLDQAAPFKLAANRAAKSSFALVENHNLSDEMVDMMGRRIEEVIDLGFDHFAYYYYPRNVADQDAAMRLLSSAAAKRGAVRPQVFVSQPALPHRLGESSTTI